MDKEELILTLLNVVWSNINPRLVKTNRNTKSKHFLKNDFQNAFVNRIVGFLGELAYVTVTADRPGIFPGGWFVPDEKEDNPLAAKCYYTVADSIGGDLVKVYTVLAKHMPEKQLFVLVAQDGIDVRNLSRDSYAYYLFSRTESVFQQVSHTEFFQCWKKRGAPRPQLPDIRDQINRETVAYVKRLLSNSAISAEALRLKLLDRFVFDVEIAGHHLKGRPSDIDFIKLRSDGCIVPIDVKDKYVSRKGTLGVNLDHLPFFLDLDQIFGTESQYVVRVSETGPDRALVEWRYIAMREFSLARTGRGNCGANGKDAEDTPELPLADFKVWSPPGTKDP
ncbi:hypothetical protein [Noviherbaspirillum cavernae]|nr:hypothetical protein [Noviherbaspirillum cavernae]